MKKNKLTERSKKHPVLPVSLKLLPAALLLALCLFFSGCSSSGSGEDTVQSDEVSITSESDSETGDTSKAEGASLEEDSNVVDLDSIPEYDDSPYVVVNDNEPYFTEEDMTEESFETYSDLDSLDRCGEAFANIGKDLMPTEERESISSVKPTGWQSVTYDGIDGNYLYNRCHLIGYQLTGENANEENLITGTRYLNVEGMLPFENMVADYIEETGNHVLYRVTPIFEGDNLVASGVQMEALSVEDEGEGITFNVYCYNVQPGIGIDYETGDSWIEDESLIDYDSDSGEDSSRDFNSSDTSSSSGSDSDSGSTTYILNTNTMKFHYPDCSSVDSMSEKNKKTYTGSRSDLISQGYDPCGSCNP